MFSAEYIVTRGYRYTLLADIAAAAKHQPTIHEYPHRKHPTSSTNSHRQNGQIKELVSAQPVEEGPQERPKTHRYPSLNGTDPKFRRNHRHALHGTMKALKEVKDGKRDAA
ncbi:hypothetical protein EG328_003912 [Venturia inaequalis]|uniref:60S ribosomal protein L29 n=1 Tax=Venturia inaequalis TaxID=5025 RepID=A0A8H3US94_VENIN|nr:hypothetical protein EG328_003912 [Venturia inaequalis]KAE9992624.1 hypothetical protein EG327_008367 [Venturia inaequalis]